MGGFLSNNWRDGLAILGVTLTLLQSVVLLREWIWGKEKRKTLRLRFGFLDEEPESSPEDKRLIRIAFSISCAAVAVCSIASGFVSGGGCFAEMVRIWSPFIIGAIALLHEAALLHVTTQYLTSRVARENFGRLGVVLSAIFFALFLLSYWIVSSYEKYNGSWFLRLLLYYAGAYLLTFIALTVRELIYQVDEWKESKKKKEKMRLW